jgi:cytoskeleton protein RodZ
MKIGEALAARRGERGLSIEQAAAATRIRAEHLQWLEADEFARFAAPVYAKAFLRAYATFLGLDAGELVGQLPRESQSNQRRRRVGRTTPALAAAGVVLLASALAGYTWRQVTVNERAIAALSSPSRTGVPATPAASPAIQARRIVVGVRVTDSVWINAIVDGTPQYGDSGRTLPAGSIVYFTGVDVTITSGKASATFISIDGRSLGPMGVGVATREFSSQTSP